jgi:peptidyl-prolyl cis-trans isomerase C
MRFIQPRSVFSIVVILMVFYIPAWAGTTVSPDDKMAVVNGTVITRKELNREIKIFKDQLARSGNQIPDLQLEAIKPKILESLVEQELLLQESRKKGVTVLPEEVEKQFSTVRNRYPTKEEFIEAIARINLTEDELKKKISKVFAINLFVNNQIIDKITVTDEEAKSYYDSHRDILKQPAQVKASLILIKLDLSADKEKTAAAEKKIKIIQEKLEAGEDFAELAKQYSEDPSSVKGGDLGYFSRGQTMKSIEDIAFALKPNDVSDAVQTPIGLQIIKVFDKKPEKNPSYEKVKDRIIVQVRKKKIQKELGQYVNKLKGAAKIEMFIE